MMQNDPHFKENLNATPNFYLRQAVERLREGLFDPLGVKLLTTGEAALKRRLEAQFENLRTNQPAHLCVCGAYGQGKSHTLNYIRQRGLEKNYVVAGVNLDPRQTPFHNLKQVYRAVMAALTFPGDAQDNRIETAVESAEFADIWKKRAKQWRALPENSGKTVADMIPQTIAHRFRSILTAMAHPTESIPNTKRGLKRHAAFKPREFPWVLSNALMGKDMPADRLRNALKYRQVPFYKNESLACRDPRAYLQTLKGYGALFRNMGYSGLIVLFDEAESIMLAALGSRSKSYSILHEIFCPEETPISFLPVFAFTEDFFTRLKDEDFERTRNGSAKTQAGEETATRVFERDYHQAWTDIHTYRLRNLTATQWRDIILKLTAIHSMAYHWHPDGEPVNRRIRAELSAQADAEARMKLKWIINTLDIEQQRMQLSSVS